MEVSSATNLALLVLRAATGLTLAAHGWNKFFSGGRLPGTGRWFDSIGMRPGRLNAWLAAGTEVGAGVLLAAGLVTPVSAGGVIGVMVVAGWTVHRSNGFFILKEGWGSQKLPRLRIYPGCPRRGCLPPVPTGRSVDRWK